MSQIEAVFFDCDGILIDGEVICSRAYVSMFQALGITLGLEEIFKRFEGVKLYEIIDIINKEHGVELAKADLEPVYRVEVARLFDTELEVIAGANALLDSMAVPVCVISNGPVSKMQHLLGKLGMLYHSPDLLFSGYDIQRWKSDPALMFHVAKVMDINVESCILVDDSSAGAQAGIAAEMEVFYFCADPYNKPIGHPKVTTSTDLAQLLELWKVQGWNIVEQTVGPISKASSGEWRRMPDTA